MAKQIINVGITENDRRGDPIRIALQKTNSNFTEVYDSVATLQNTTGSLTTAVGELETAIENIEFTGGTQFTHIGLTARFSLGPIVSFAKTLGGTQFDPIDTGLTITRDARTPETDGGGIYNSEVEEVDNPLVSPVGLLWNWDGWDNLDTVKQREYVNFRQALKNSVGRNVVGAELVAHDTINNKYYTFKFSQWAQGAQHAGEFAYQRRLIATSTSVGITFADGTNQVTAAESFSRYPQTYIGDVNNHTLVLEDAGKHVLAFGVNVIVPNHTTVDYAIGSVIKIVADGQPATIVAAQNVSIRSATSFAEENGSFIIPANAIATLLKIRQGKNADPDIWKLSIPSINPILPYTELTNNPFIFEPYAGELISFTKEDYATGNTARDEIDEDLAITRGNIRGIYNPYLELEWDNNTNDGNSPVGTLWNKDGWDDLTNLASRNYYSFYDVNLGSIGGNVIGTEFVMKDTANDKYYKFDITVWGQSGQGAPVTYTRTLLNPITGDAIGDPVEFVKVGNANPTQVNDPIDVDLTLARGNNQGIYNIALETSWNSIGDGEDSPEGTEWNADGWRDFRDVTTRTYGTFLATLGNVGQNIVGTELVMHDIINDKYWAIKFSSWTQNGEGGGFSYTRQLINTSQRFVKTDNGNEVDEISNGLHITRVNQDWLYNPLEDEGPGNTTPTGSLWNNDGWDDFRNVETRSYIPFVDIWNGNYNEIPGSLMVMKDTTTDKYWAIQFLSWTQGGGFSYLRYELDLDQLREGIAFADGTIQKTAYIPTNVVSTAPGLRRIETASGYKQVSVTPVTRGETLNATIRNTSNSWDFYVDATEPLNILYDQNFDERTYRYFEFSFDNEATWVQVTFGGGSFGEYYQMVFEDGVHRSVTEDDVVRYRVVSGGDSVIWWDKSELPSGSIDFRGAVIDYHAFTNEATWIGTIHIVDDNGEEYITHTEVSSGSDDGMNDNLWIVTNEGSIRYARFDGEAKTLKIHWTAKVFYGDETYD